MIMPNQKEKEIKNNITKSSIIDKNEYKNFFNLLSSINNDNIPRWVQHSIAGAGAGAVSSLLTCPLDVTKTILQVENKYNYNSKSQNNSKYLKSIELFKKIIKKEGIRGCYKGLGTTFMTLIPTWGVYFCIYNHFKDFGSKFGFSESFPLHMSAATTAALITDITVTPLFVIKTRLQTQILASLISQPHEKLFRYKSTWDAFCKIILNEGFTALWKGLTPQLLGVIHVSIQFGLYEYLKQDFYEKKKYESLTTFDYIIASSISKFFASVIAYPHEVLRALFQVQHYEDSEKYKNIWDATIKIIKKEGMKGLYKGLGVNLIRVIPSTAITLTTYEQLIKLFTNIK